jgi:hypothetical protein
VFLVNSHPGLFTVTPFCTLKQVQSTYQGHPFFRSYGAILPSSLTRVISSTLGYSPHLPVSVCGTVTRKARLEVFLGNLLKTSLWACALPITSRSKPGWICLPWTSTGLDHVFQHVDGLHFCVTPWLKRLSGGSRILTAFPSLTPFGLSLGTDLP